MLSRDIGYAAPGGGRIWAPRPAPPPAPSRPPLPPAPPPPPPRPRAPPTSPTTPLSRLGAPARRQGGEEPSGRRACVAGPAAAAAPEHIPRAGGAAMAPGAARRGP